MPQHPAAQDLRAALEQLVSSASALTPLVEQLSSGLELARPTLDNALDQLLRDSRRVRELISSTCEQLGIARPAWSTRQELERVVGDLVEKLEDLALQEGWQRLQAVVDELRGAHIRHRQAARASKLESLRSNALQELDARIAGRQHPAPSVPWPKSRAASWIHWLLTLEEPEASQAHSEIGKQFPVLEDLLTALEIDSWVFEVTPQASVVEPSLWQRAKARIVDVAALVTSPFTSDDASGADQISPAVVSATRDAELERDSIPSVSSQDSAAGTAHPTSVDAISAIPNTSTSVHEAHEDLGGVSSQSENADELVFQNEPTNVPIDDLGIAESRVKTADLEQHARPRRPSPHEQFRVSAPPSLPPELVSFERYQASFWRNPDGIVESAPWLAEHFDAQLRIEAEQAFASGRWNYLLLFARAAEERRVEALPRPKDVLALASLMSKPLLDGRGTDNSRLELLQQYAESPQPTFRLRLLLILEALAPTDVLLPVAHLRLLSEKAGFDCPALVTVLEHAFQVNAEGERALSALRLAQQATESPEELAAQLAKAKTSLREHLDEVWQTPRNIKTRHCRDVWQVFMERAQPKFSLLIKTADATIDLRQIDRLEAEYGQLADRGDAAFDDRKRMNRAVGKLLDLARDVVRLSDRVRTQQRRPSTTKAVQDLITAYRGSNASGARTGKGAFYLALLDQVVAGTPMSIGMQLTERDFIERPALLESIATIPGDGDAAVDVLDVVHPLIAAALLVIPVTPGGTGMSITARLRQLERDDLLVHVQPISVRESQHAASVLTNAQVDLERELSEAERLTAQLRLSASSAAEPLRAVIEEARKISNECAPYVVKPQVLADWIRRTRAVGQHALSQVVDGLHRQASESEADRAIALTNALEQHRLADALAIAAGEPLPLPANMYRAIISRFEAKGRWSPNPQSFLSAVRGEQASRVASLWFRQGIRGGERDNDLRTSFAQFVFEPIARVQQKRRGTLDSLVVPCGVLREWLANTDHNPSFLPQLTSFNSIGIVTPPTSPTDEAFVRKTVEALSRSSDAQVIVLLAPRITTSVRDAFRQEIQRRSWRNVTVIDDIDLLRLFNPGGQVPDLPVGLLELVLEQQPKWSPVNPFELLEGQHTKPEMYVGRREEAERLAKTANYSRVFSGRRLGKSALLKHISDTYHGRRSLPSSHVLRVVYAPIVGIQDDEHVVDRICEAFREQLDHTPMLAASRPETRLKELLDTWLAKNTKASVLVFLDEADMFVEAQVRRYERERETCLTWKMRTEFERSKDRNDLPRVRFVFAGYRATHLSEGAWANWGDVLRLQPLTASEAAQLIAGPLARLGIDASLEANAIAFQCGYQPAVIVRFGQQLLQHLDATLTPAQRERPQITAEHVAHVFQSSALQQEIRKIVWNNFQGNTFGKVVFAAALLEFGSLPPGAALDDAPQQVLGRLRAIEPRFLATDTAKGSPLDRIARELREFVDRSLLVSVSATDQTYRLRFPHHLPILLQEDQESVIRQEVTALGGESDSVDIVRSMLTNTSLDELADALGPIGAELGVNGVVAASQWMPALEAGAAKLTTRLGMLSNEVLVNRASAHELKDLHRAVLNASPALADGVVRDDTAERHPPRLFVGGVDLLRWSLRRESSSTVERASVGRLGLAQLRWWFERVRAVNFSGSNPAARFHEMTGGIPFLVDLLDSALERTVGFDGAAASDHDLSAVSKLYADELDGHAKRLSSGDSKIKLERRELELLVLYAHVSRMFPNDRKTCIEVMRGWLDWRNDFPLELKDVVPLEASDLVHLELLVRIGWIPTDPLASGSRVTDRMAALSKNDPLQTLATTLLRCLST